MSAELPLVESYVAALSREFLKMGHKLENRVVYES